MARPHRQREPHGEQPHRPGAQHRRRSRPRSPTATSAQKITVDARGEILELKQTINTMVDQLSSFADEVTRVAREVGTEGTPRRPGRGQGRQRHVARPHRERELPRLEPHRPGAQHRAGHDRGRDRRPVAEDRRRRAGRDRSSSRTRSTRWSTSSRSFAAEVTRVAREVGTEGKLGGQAEVEGVSRHVARPDRERQPARRQPHRPGAQHRAGHDRGRQRRPVARRSPSTRRARSPSSRTRSTRWSTSSTRSPPRSRASRARSARRASSAARRRSRACRGTWRGLTDNVNLMAGNLTEPGARDRARHDGRRQRRPVQEDRHRGQGRDPRAVGHDQHDGRPALVVRRRGHARRARGRHGGQLGGQAEVKGVSGTWRDLTENVNFMAANLTDQVRNIAQVATAVANGDLTPEDHRRRAAARSSSSRRRSTRWSTSCQSFADEVTRVAREVGTRGPARRPGRGRGRQRHVARPDRERQPARRQPHDAGARDRRGLDRGDAGRPHAPDLRRGRRARSPSCRTRSTR